MKRVIDHEGCREPEGLSPKEMQLDRGRAIFAFKRKIKVTVGRRYLGVAWLVLNPVITALIYFFVFTVIRSNPNSTSLLIGICMFAIFSSSFKSGVNSLVDFSGGLRAERVRTRVLTMSMVGYRGFESVIQTSGIAAILILGLGVGWEGIISLVFLSLIMAFIAEGLGQNLSILAKRVPDIANIINHLLLLMFFASPVLYPMSMTSGMHYRVNEYNPFTYFVEAVRGYAEVESAFADLWNVQTKLIVGFLVILAFRGYATLDRQRWEVSSWS